ncbi:hypothetical protein PFBG_03012 [Plasmodium falciparum 7G8]|uniref:Uncharacterized protein n=1 Tax=Plasmodium falciparum (isolate 7G8) TaxID=57266 RepID=W7FE12_PLAF8|nr:hypothetical protein PFBG_03012 [Plasmodium falciparum 7G8]
MVVLQQEDEKIDKQKDIDKKEDKKNMSTNRKEYKKKKKKYIISNKILKHIDNIDKLKYVGINRIDEKQKKSYLENIPGGRIKKLNKQINDNKDERKKKRTNMKKKKKKINKIKVIKKRNITNEKQIVEEKEFNELNEKCSDTIIENQNIIKKKNIDNNVINNSNNNQINDVKEMNIFQKDSNQIESFNKKNSLKEKNKTSNDHIINDHIINDHIKNKKKYENNLFDEIKEAIKDDVTKQNSLNNLNLQIKAEEQLILSNYDQNKMNSQSYKKENIYISHDKQKSNLLMNSSTELKNKNTHILQFKHAKIKLDNQTNGDKQSIADSNKIIEETYAGEKTTIKKKTRFQMKSQIKDRNKDIKSKERHIKIKDAPEKKKKKKENVIIVPDEHNNVKKETNNINQNLFSDKSEHVHKNTQEMNEKRILADEILKKYIEMREEDKNKNEDINKYNKNHKTCYPFFEGDNIVLLDIKEKKFNIDIINVFSSNKNLEDNCHDILFFFDSYVKKNKKEKMKNSTNVIRPLKKLFKCEYFEMECIKLIIHIFDKIISKMKKEINMENITKCFERDDHSSSFISRIKKKQEIQKRINQENNTIKNNITKNYNNYYYNDNKKNIFYNTFLNNDILYNDDYEKQKIYSILFYNSPHSYVCNEYQVFQKLRQWTDQNKLLMLREKMKQMEKNKENQTTHKRKMKNINNFITTTNTTTTTTSSNNNNNDDDQMNCCHIYHSLTSNDNIYNNYSHYYNNGVSSYIPLRKINIITNKIMCTILNSCCIHDKQNVMSTYKEHAPSYNFPMTKQKHWNVTLNRELLLNDKASYPLRISEAVGTLISK